MATGKIYDEEVFDNISIRTFSINIDDHESLWHRDLEDREIEVIYDSGWLFQFDNELPISINDVKFIPKNKWHRIIKGNGDLKIKVTKIF